MILDTCALLWLAEGGGKLSRPALKQVGEASVLYVSAITAFEIGVKVAQGKLALPRPTAEWFGEVVDHHGIIVLPLEIDVCVTAAELPAIHNDPFDRFIIAAAKLGQFPVVTADARFEDYGVSVIS